MLGSATLFSLPLMLGLLSSPVVILAIFSGFTAAAAHFGQVVGTPFSY